MNLAGRSKQCLFAVMFLVSVAKTNAQSISLVSGNGQLLDTSTHSQSQPLVVVVRDAQNNPVKNIPVKWAVAPIGQGNVLSAGTTTDSSGQASNIFTSTNGNLDGNSFVQSIVTASGAGGSVQFNLTTVESEGGTDYDHVVLISPSSASRKISGSAGQQGGAPVTVSVVGAIAGNQQGHGIPNVSLAVVQGDPSDLSTISCAGKVVYTDSAGNAMCNLVLGGQIGSGSFQVVVGSTSFFPGFSYVVEVGPPAAFINLTGNHQSGNPAQQLPLSLGATLTDVGGNPVAGVSVTFTPVGDVTLNRVNTTTDANGKASAIATLGNGAGPVQVVIATASGISATFDLVINVVVTGLSIVSGNQQTVIENAPFPSPLTVQVLDGTTPVPGVNVAFAVTSGSATLATPIALTDAAGQASTTVTAGGNAGPVIISASASGTNKLTVTQAFNLSVSAPGPVCNLPNTFFNGASLIANEISPGAVAVIHCTSGVADGLQGTVSGESGLGPEVLPYEVQHVTVQFGEAKLGHYAPIYYVANIDGAQSIAIQVPFELYPLSGSTVPVTISANGLTVNLTASIQQGAPGIFEYVLPDNVTKNAIMLHADGSLVTPQKPALGGETVRTYVTGLIPPLTKSGASTVASNSTVKLSGVTITTPVLVAIDGAGIAPPSTTYAAGMIGVWQVEFVVPSGVAPNALTRFTLGIPVDGKTVVAKASRFPLGPLP